MEKIKIGVFGAGRGVDIAVNFQALGCEMVAICVFHTERREAGKKTLGVDVAYDNFDDFIQH